MWANRNSEDFLSKSGEVKLARAMKGDNSESRRESGGAGGWMGRFLGDRIFFIGTSGEGTLEGVDDLNLTCLGFDFMVFNSIEIFFAGQEFFSETLAKMEKPHSSSYASSYALQDLQHSCMTSHISCKYIETTSKLYLRTKEKDTFAYLYHS